MKGADYAHLPGPPRAFGYFFYCCAIRLGFLDGPVGTAFHFLPGFLYWYLVDTKGVEVKKSMREKDVDLLVAAEQVFWVKVENTE